MPHRDDHPDDPSGKAPSPEPVGSRAQGASLDQLTAHLDRGWDLVSRGELSQATVSAQHVLALDKEAPEGYTLLGAIRAAEGDAEEAMAHFREAMELDPEYLDPILYAAELSLHPRGEVDECIRLCDEALELLGEEHVEERVDALLLKVDALLARGDEDEARLVLSSLPTGPFADAVFHLRAGRACFDLGLSEEAEEHMRAALAENAKLADAYYFLGLIHEQRGDFATMVRTFRRVRDLDLEEPLPPWSLSEQAFEGQVARLVASLPERIRTLLGKAPVFVADYPALELVAEGYDPRMPVFIIEGPTLLDSDGSLGEKVSPEGDPAELGAGSAPASEAAPAPAKSGNGRSNGNGHRNGHRNGHGPESPPALSPEGLARIDDGTPRVSCIFLYRRNLHRGTPSLEELEQEVRHALIHELGHFYGFSDEEMEALDMS